MSTVYFAGFSRVAGALKFRTANNVNRINQLRKLGDTDVVILALPSEMSKNAAAKYVLSNLASGDYMVNVAEAETLLIGLIKDENPFANQRKPKKTATVKVTKSKSKPSIPTPSDEAPMSSKQAAKIRAEFMKKLEAAYEAN